MITFKKLRWKNLLSTGNAFTEIILDDSPNALIIGENGAGKSTILDALCFSLFGKAFRNINKGGLVNSVNQKGLLAEIEFSVSSKNYKVIRGIKPNVFEIWCNGICLNQDSSTKDYQEHLEKFILKMTYKSFTQIVILGSASFKPFMQLTPADRRVIIEDLLDIQIFSVMNTIAKMRFVSNKEATSNNRIEGEAKKDKLLFVEKTHNSLKQNNDLKLQQLHKEYDELQASKTLVERDITELTERMDFLFDQIKNESKLRNKLSSLNELKTKIDSNSSRCTKDIHFYSSNDSCPACKQNLESSFIQNMIGNLNNQNKEYTSALKAMSEKIETVVQDIRTIEKHTSEIHKLRSDISSKKTLVKSIDQQIRSVQDAIEKIKIADELTLNSERELLSLRDEVVRLDSERERLIEERVLIDTAIQLLKDGGIKTKIIKQYLPIINKQINHYLAQMGFFANFNIDENFNETIKSRYRDEFSYHNFSEGEKTRVDLAILFTWRYIAKMRNSINTNLLLFDEIFDGSLDGNGTDEFLKIMWNLAGNTNVFVISHKQDVMIDKFSKVYKFKKSKNFSVVT
jgi:DNA repair exonuclease SbcCD ATPase subunit